VAKLLVQKGFDLLELTPEVVNLEEIFLELTREDAPVAEAIENPPLEESEA
jgi:hypothetical protein